MAHVGALLVLMMWVDRVFMFMHVWRYVICSKYNMLYQLLRLTRASWRQNVVLEYLAYFTILRNRLHRVVDIVRLKRSTEQDAPHVERGEVKPKENTYTHRTLAGKVMICLFAGRTIQWPNRKSSILYPAEWLYQCANWSSCHGPKVKQHSLPRGSDDGDDDGGADVDDNVVRDERKTATCGAHRHMCSHCYCLSLYLEVTMPLQQSTCQPHILQHAHTNGCIGASMLARHG